MSAWAVLDLRTLMRPTHSMLAYLLVATFLFL